MNTLELQYFSEAARKVKEKSERERKKLKKLIRLIEKFCIVNVVCKLFPMQHFLRDTMWLSTYKNDVIALQYLIIFYAGFLLHSFLKTHCSTLQMVHLHTCHICAIVRYH